MEEFKIRGKLLMETEYKHEPLLQDIPENMGVVDSFQTFTEAQNSSVDSLKYNTAIMKEFGDVMPDIIKNFRAMNEIVARTNQNLPAVRKIQTSEELKEKRIDEMNRQNFLQLVNGGSSAVQTVANGNVGGAYVQGAKNISGMANNLSKMAETEGLEKLSKGLLAGGTVVAAIGAVGAAANSLADKYIEEMPSIFGTGRAFGSMSNADSMNSWLKVNEKNKGTGLDNDTFNQLAQNLRTQGLGNGILDRDTQIDYISNIAQTTSRWAYKTGGDANQYAELAGLMGRYGGSKDVAGDFNHLVSAGYASGLNDNQIPEFLSGIQKVMEDGIVKGFSRSATEVADTLLMFSKMSGGNPFWQGEQGVRLLNQANNGIASATALSKTEDIIVYSAIDKAYEDKKTALGKDLFVEDGDYVNTMMLMERGLNEENFSSIMDSLDDAYGDNTAAKIEALRKMTGLNYTGAARIFNLDRDASDTEIKDILKDPENLNNETQRMEALNKIREAVVKLGEKPAEIKIAGIDGISKGVDKIYDWISQTHDENTEREQLLDNMSIYGKAYIEKLKKDNPFVEFSLPIEQLRSISEGNYNIYGNQGTVLSWDTPNYMNINKPDEKAVAKVQSIFSKDGYGIVDLSRQLLTHSESELMSEPELEKIMQMIGDSDIEKELIKKLGLNKNFVKSLDAYKSKISDATSDKYITERENAIIIENLKQLVDMFKDGITVNYNKQD